MKKEKLFLALLMSTLIVPTPFTSSILAQEEVMEDTSTTTNLDDSAQGSLSIQVGNKTFNNTTDLVLDSVPYTATTITPTIKVTWTSKDGKTTSLSENTDFSIEWKNNTQAGTATGTLQFKGSYTGATRTIKFKITPISLTKNSTTIVLGKDTYSLDKDTGKIEPTITSVKVGNLTLGSNDYKVSYSNNNQVGTGVVTITGEGNFEGSISKNFTITGIALNDVNMTSLKGITHTSGPLDSKEKEILQKYLNDDANLNPYKYEYIVEKATIQRSGDQANFELTLSAHLKDESLIDLTFMNLPSRNKNETAMESIEEMETESTFYQDLVIEENGKKVTIQGIAAQDAFRVNGKINSTTIRNILRENYKVDNLDFSSNQGKDSKFAVKNLKDPICIEVETSKKVTPTPSTPIEDNRPSTPMIPTPTEVGTKTLYRFFNKETGEHFYTSSESERNELMKDSAWNNEGYGWTAPETSDFPIYRLCNPNTGEHHYTMDENEYETLQKYGWTGEGTGWYSANPSDGNVIALYRLYNPKAKEAGSHHYTASEKERDGLMENGWSYEGIAWYGLEEK